jgi:large subunit ribosomal protein L22
MSGAASKLWRAVGGRARSSALASTSFARAAVVENLAAGKGAWSTTVTRSTTATTVARAWGVDGSVPFAARGARASAGAFAESGNDGASTATRGDEPGASPLRRAPAPASAMRGAFIPGALTDGGLSERASAVLRGAKGSPKKFGAFLRVVRGLRAEDALIQCNLSPKRVAKTIGKVIQSAIGNAVNNQGLDRDRLIVAEATCGKGQYLRRVSIHGRGRAGTMHRPRSHVRVTLEESDEEPKRRVRVHDDEMPWERRRRLGRAKQAIAEAAGIV